MVSTSPVISPHLPESKYPSLYGVFPPGEARPTLEEIMTNGTPLPLHDAPAHHYLLLDRQDLKAYVARRDQTLVFFAIAHPDGDDPHTVFVDDLLMSPGTEDYKQVPSAACVEQAASLIGADYPGWLTHDGWAVYYKFLRAGHQSCISHLLRRCRDMAAVSTPAAARFPHQVKAILEKGLALRDRYQKHEISRHGLWTATGRLEAELDRWLARRCRDSANRRLAKHLQRERPYLFTFLYCPGLDATNNAAERALRPLVVARKNWGGNRTQKGAHAQAVLTSILQTAKQQGKNPFQVVVELLCCNEKKKILDLVPFLPGAPRDSLPAPPRRVAHGLLSPSKTEFALPLEAAALYAAPTSVDGALAPVEPR